MKNEEHIVEVGETSADFGRGVTITFSEKSAQEFLRELKDTENHCGCRGGYEPFRALIRKLEKVIELEEEE